MKIFSRFFISFYPVNYELGNKKDCGEDEFRCNNGECFPNNYICDGYNDCSDWEDELPPVCPCQKEKQFACKNGKQCINIHAVCDQYIDCKDGSDEDKSACP